MLGVSSDRILDHYRENISSQEIQRSDILTKKDINNVKQTYNIDLRNGCRYSVDAVSIDLWIKELETQENNPVLFYKKQGVVSELETLLIESDFCLILMNSVQAEVLKNFGSNIICIDSTHGLNPYDFELTTLMVLDEFSKGFPVACMYSNRKDTYINEIFFRHIKNKVGAIHSMTFMSDITNTYFNAWCLVMGTEVKNRLYCSWHIDRAWQNNLSKVKNMEKRKWVYQTLKYLQRILECDKFEKEFHSFIQLLMDEDPTKDMGIYLKNNYSNCTKQWAYCYRKRCGISTNMHIENMHKILKHTYLQGKKVKRLDKSVHFVQKLIRDKIIDRLIKLTKGKSTKQCQQISAQHRLALTIKSEITAQEGNQFVIKIANNNEHYVTKIHDNPYCNLKCVYCNICIHSLECTCIDFNIKNIICKHIHCVCLGNFNVTKAVICEGKNKIENNVELNMLISNPNIAIPSKLMDEAIKEQIKSNLLDIYNKVENEEHSSEHLKDLLDKSKNMLMLLKVESKTPFISVDKNIKK
ncbi:uncharacterized protein LOC126746702 [Anthonomus grandis grandis]|uniref:uncharacterized protein LOC126746702 n=1 Tax=Anthonomus grandis grandis TaxID=2921223 RepID=UPI00216585BD|nr:uncharacterized protein LOC126746702 [Anthonomus grandis grandis]